VTVKLDIFLKNGLLVFTEEQLQTFDNDRCDAISRKSVTPALLQGLKFENLSLLAQDGCSVVTSHLTAVIIQNYHI
jgi:hypothetical protein